MISAFGVDHGGAIAKSYLGGGTWKAATKLTAAERKTITSTRPNLRSRGRSREHQQFAEDMKGVRAHTSKMRSSVEIGRADPFGGSAAATMRVGGKKTGQSFIFGQSQGGKTRQRIVSHEMQHATPKRTSYRLHGQIARNPEKLMREEARADLQGSGRHYTRSKNPVTRSGYERVAQTQRLAEKAPRRPEPAARELFRTLGLKPPTNKEAHRSVLQQFKTNQTALFGGHYAKGDTEAAVRAYRKTQNKIYRAKMSPAQKKAKLRARKP